MAREGFSHQSNKILYYFQWIGLIGLRECLLRGSAPDGEISGFRLIFSTNPWICRESSARQFCAARSVRR